MRECKGVQRSKAPGQRKGVYCKEREGQRVVVPLVIGLEVYVRAIGAGVGLAVVLRRGH